MPTASSDSAIQKPPPSRNSNRPARTNEAAKTGCMCAPQATVSSMAISSDGRLRGAPPPISQISSSISAIARTADARRRARLRQPHRHGEQVRG
jgi:hypothetical protein